MHAMQALLLLLLAQVTLAARVHFTQDSTREWSQVFVAPPPDECKTSWTKNRVCNPLQHAVKEANPFTTIFLEGGIYFNKGFGQSKTNGYVLRIEDKNNLEIKAVDGARPVLAFDGDGGILISGNSSNIVIDGLKVEGPSERISGNEASLERLRSTSRTVKGELTGVCSTYECTSCLEESSCTATKDCDWSETSDGKCMPVRKTYYNGKGIGIRGTVGTPIHSVTVQNCEVSHCPSSALRADRSDNITFAGNLVYGNCWWTHSASSAIVFGEMTGSLMNTISGNIVYGNRNFLPFYSPNRADRPGSSNDNPTYGQWMQDYIIDGSAVYLTRNQNYTGTMLLEGNIAFDNGINGLVVHHTDHESVKVIVKDNLLFENGKTSREIEHRQKAGGLVVNSGNNVLLRNNKVYTTTEQDFAFQCFNGCTVEKESRDNYACSGQVNKVFKAALSEPKEEGKPPCDADLEAIRAGLPKSGAPADPQYCFFNGAEACP